MGRTWLCALVLLAVSTYVPCASAIRGAPRSLKLADIPGDVFADSPRDVLTAPYAAFTGVGYFNVGHGFCTGAMVAPNVVLTAAHCVFNEDGSLADVTKMSFIPGVSTDTQGNAVSPYGAGIAVLQAHPHPEYVALRRQSPEYFTNKTMVDVAVLVLDSSVGDNTNIFELAPSCSVRSNNGQLLASLNVQLAGYPFDYNSVNKTMVQTACTLHSGSAAGQDDDCSDAVLYHQCSIRGGNSGGPMWITNPTTYISTIFATTGGEDTWAMVNGAYVDCQNTLNADAAACENISCELNDSHIQFINSFIP